MSIPNVPNIPDVPQIPQQGSQGASDTNIQPTPSVNQQTQPTVTLPQGHVSAPQTPVQQAQVQTRPTLSIEKIMQASFGEIGEDVRTSFKKTVLIKQYETEVIEAESTLHFDKKLTGAERMFICAALQVQLEYTAYCQLAFKNMVTETELREHRAELEQGLTAIKDKAELVLGKSLDNYIEIELG